MQEPIEKRHEPVGEHSESAPDAPVRTGDDNHQEDQSQFAVEWQQPGDGSNGRLQECKIDGQKRYDKRARKSLAQAQWHARRRAERFATRLGFRPTEQQPSSDSPPAQQRAIVLVVGGLGDLGQKQIQPALAELPPGIADCLDYVDGRPGAK
jgi:hypothetical protein